MVFYFSPGSVGQADVNVDLIAVAVICRSVSCGVLSCVLHVCVRHSCGGSSVACLLWRNNDDGSSVAVVCVHVCHAVHVFGECVGSSASVFIFLNSPTGVADGIAVDANAADVAEERGGCAGTPRGTHSGGCCGAGSRDALGRAAEPGHLKGERHCGGLRGGCAGIPQGGGGASLAEPGPLEGKRHCGVWRGGCAGTPSGREGCCDALGRTAEPGPLQGGRVAAGGRCAGTPRPEQSDLLLFSAFTVLAGFQLIVILVSSFSFSFLFPVYGTLVATFQARRLLLPGALGDPLNIFIVHGEFACISYVCCY